MTRAGPAAHPVSYAGTAGIDTQARNFRFIEVGMTKRTATITLAGEQYVVPALNVGQIERFMEVIGAAPTRGALAMTLLRIALERADPKIENFDDMEPTLPEITFAGEEISRMSGLQKPDENPPPALKAAE